MLNQTAWGGITFGLRLVTLVRAQGEGKATHEDLQAEFDQAEPWEVGHAAIFLAGVIADIVPEEQLARLHLAAATYEVEHGG